MLGEETVEATDDDEEVFIPQTSPRDQLKKVEKERDAARVRTTASGQGLMSAKPRPMDQVAALLVQGMRSRQESRVTRVERRVAVDAVAKSILDSIVRGAMEDFEDILAIQETEALLARNHSDDFDEDIEFEDELGGDGLEAARELLQGRR